VMDELAQKRDVLRQAGKWSEEKAMKELRAALAFDCDFSDYDRDEGGMTLLMWAAALRNASAARALILSAPHRSYVDLKLGKRGIPLIAIAGFTTALHLACMTTNNFDLVKILVNAGANAHALDILGWDCLMHATTRGELSIVRYILERFPGWNLERREFTQGCTVLHLALGRGSVSLEIVKTLLEKGAKIETRSNAGATCLMRATANVDCDPMKVESLLYKVDEARIIQWKNGEPQCFSVKDRLDARRRPSMFKYFLQRCWRFARCANAPLTMGATALHFAASRGDVDVIRILLEAGADPTIRTDRGMTVLDMSNHFGPFAYVESTMEEYMLADGDTEDDDDRSVISVF